jgi:hypothetical protein
MRYTPLTHLGLQRQQHERPLPDLAPAGQSQRHAPGA